MNEYPLSYLIIFIFIIATCYFLPSIIAYFRNRHRFRKIFLFNLLLGWTGIVWIAMLCWSIAKNREFEREDDDGWESFFDALWNKKDSGICNSDSSGADDDD